jgi:pimeloyl-ACP methyl ester carboxylesterase
VPTPTVVLVHGAFADSSSWNEVIARLDEDDVPVVAVANPLRGLAEDAHYLSDILDAVAGEVVLVGHGYGGMVITEAGSRDAVAALVYVSAYAPDRGESADELSRRFPGSTLRGAVAGYPVRASGRELVLRRESFAEQLAADVPEVLAATMSATQRPVAESALTDVVRSSEPAWRTRPSWFVYGDADRSIPPAALRFMADRAGPVRRRVIWDGSHALEVSQPDAVADVVLEAVAAVGTGDRPAD